MQTISAYREISGLTGSLCLVTDEKLLDKWCLGQGFSDLSILKVLLSENCCVSDFKHIFIQTESELVEYIFNCKPKSLL